MTDTAVPQYTEDERRALIDQQFEALSTGKSKPEFSLKDVTDEQTDSDGFKAYYQRFLDHELTQAELDKYDGDFVTALKEKDRANKPDFIEGTGHRLRRDEKSVINDRPATDLGNAERLVDQFSSEIRYCHQFTGWYIWDYQTGRWKKDQNGFIYRIAKDVIRRIHVESSRAPLEERRKRLSSWAIECENRSHLNGMTELAANEKPIIVSPDDLDKDDYLFNLRSGVFNLKSFELQNHDKRQYITKLADFEYNPKAKCPLFLQYLDRTFRSNPKKDEIISYLKRAAGYSLTGSTAEQCLFLLYGSGSNGKSVFISIMKALLGEYGVTTQSRTFTTDRGEISNDVAALAGSRFVCASENSSDTSLDESMIKQLTGGDEVSARFLHQEFFTYRPRFKIWWCFNHPPAITDMTPSIWRRIKIIPFTETIPEHEWDKQLAEKIIAQEISGIFNWAIEGLKEYTQYGLGEPDVVKQATRTYKDDQDILAEFFKTACEITNSELDKIQASVLYKTYTTWWYSTEEPTKPISSTKFGRLCRDRGMKKIENREGTFYINIQIKKMVKWG